MRITGICALAGSLLLLGGGCDKSGDGGSRGATQKKADQNGPIATIHWQGMDRIGKQTNAAGFLKIWRLPESEKLKSQTLDKLALAPWRVTGTNPPSVVTNYAPLLRENRSATLIRPLLDDLVKDEWYLEVRETKPDSVQMALAIRLDPKRAAAWDTNLQAVFATLRGARHASTRPASGNASWQIQLANAPATLPPYLRHVEFTHAGGWTILAFAPDQNAVLTNLISRVQRTQAPFASASGGDWLETQLDLRRLSAAFSWGWDLPVNWPEISLGAIGTGDKVWTHARLAFPEPLQVKLDPWIIPTNLMHEPIQGFTAVRGIKSWLSSLDWWKNIHSPETPNQLTVWSQGGSPFLVYAAAPIAQAEKVMAAVGSHIIETFNPLLATNRMGHWERAANSDGVLWRAPIINPFVQSTRIGNGSFLFGGLTPYLLTNSPPPFVTVAELLKETNAVYFDREITGPRVEAWMYISQLSRIILRRAQLPPTSTSIAWFRAVGAFLAPSSTTAIQTGSDSISVTRNSTIGLTACELHLFVDWLESPEFPKRPFTSVVKLPPFPPREPGQKPRSPASH